MKKFTRVISIILLGVMLMSLSSCGSKVTVVDEIPKEDQEKIENGGTIEYISYMSKDYYGLMGDVEKHAYVYLPPNYDETKQYNVMYLFHGIGGDVWEWGMTDNNSVIKKVMDNLIEDGKIEPFIVVTPNGRSAKDHGSNSDSGAFYVFGNELRYDLIPYIDANYATYAEGAGTPEYDITAARDHRAAGGLSMGSMQTINIALGECLDMFSWFGAFSSCPTTNTSDQIAEDLEKFPDYDIKFFYNLCGTEDGIAISHHSAAVDGLCEKTNKHKDGKNFIWHTRSGGHDHNIWFLGFYNFANIAFK